MHDKKAMASMVDAVIFTVILGLLVVNFIIPHQLPEGQEINNGLIHDDLLRLRFNASPIFPELGNITLSLSQMAAIEMNRDGNSSFSDLLMSIMHSMLGTGRPWMLTFVYGNLSLVFGSKNLDEFMEVVMTERSVAVGSLETVTSKLHTL